MRIPVVLLGAVAAIGLAAPAHAGPPAPAVVVKMLNKGSTGVMVFEPNIVRIQPGQSVTFTPVNPGHDAESIPGMVPAGAQPFKGAISKPITVTFTKPGVYGYKCTPHLAMGMVGVVVVGAPTNLAQAKAVALPGKAKPVMAGLLARVK